VVALGALAADVMTARRLGAAAALAACAAWCLPRAFLPLFASRAAPADPYLERGAAHVGDQASGTAAMAAAMGAASLLAVGAAASLSTRAARRTPVQPALVAMQAARLKDIQKKTPQQLVEEGRFAGGLIGGESAFKGQSYNFDPMGFSTRQPEFLPWYREAELKHGRICMLAWVGLVVPDFVRIPGPEEYYGVKNVVEAHNVFVGKNNLGPLFQVFLFVGIVEILTTFAKCTTSDGLTLENAGDYRFGLNFLPKDPEKAKEMRLKELKNGRLAMVAFGGAITQAVLSGNGFPWLYS